MPRFSIHHVTKYSYEGPVRDSANQILLYPIQDQYQELLRQTLTISGDPQIERHLDYYCNEVGSFTHAEPHTSLVIDSVIEVVTRSRPALSDQRGAADQWKMLRDLQAEAPFIDFIKQEHFPSMPELAAAARLEELLQATPLQAADQLKGYVFDKFQYIKGITSVETTLEEVWTLKAGVCQDFAHILLVLLRQAGIPARYVSGYICPNQNGMRGEGATHAWIEAFIPETGWVGLDPTNNCVVDDKHVRLAVGRHFMDCSPVKGTYKGAAAQRLEVGVSVAYESGRVMEEKATVLSPQPVKSNADENSYRRYMEMQQQQ